MSVRFGHKPLRLLDDTLWQSHGEEISGYLGGKATPVS
jgi:hypothetical protein